MRRKHLFASAPALVAAALVASGMLRCGTRAPVSGDDSVLSIRLSLNRVGSREADFTGTPVMAILQFSDTVDFSEIDWHLGKGAYLIPSVWVGDSLAVPLYWAKGLPLTYDSTAQAPFDSVSVTVRAVQSNTVKVNVINRAPVIDSIMVGDTSYFVGENIYSRNVFSYEVDTSLHVYITVWAHDLDSDVLFSAWRAVIDSLALKSFTSSGMKRIYDTPFTNFRDTVFVNIEDGRGGKVDVKLVILRRSGISPVVYDSIRVGATTYRGDSARFVHQVVSLDTLGLTVYTRAQQPILIWGASNGNLDSVGAFSATYRCTLSTKTDTLLTDTTVTLDTIRITMTNASLDTARTDIIVVKKPANQRPLIDSITVDGVRYDTLARARGGSQITLKAYAHDPDGGAVTTELQS